MSKIKNIFNAKVRVIIGLVLLVSMIGFTQVSQGDSTCNGMIVLMDNTLDNHFLDEQDVLDIATLNGEVIIEGQAVEQIDLKEMETRLRDNPYIRSTEIYKDLESNLVVSVELRRPVARVLRDTGPGAYITKSGSVMPLSDKFVPRVVLLSGNTDSLTVESYLTENGQGYLELIRHIEKDEFWKAQIAELEVLKDGKVLLYPQVTKQTVEFGDPDNLEWKFKKLKVFYKEVLPREGWNSYSRVNVEFGDQIIAQ